MRRPRLWFDYAEMPFIFLLDFGVFKRVYYQYTTTYVFGQNERNSTEYGKEG